MKTWLAISLLFVISCTQEEEIPGGEVSADDQSVFMDSSPVSGSIRFYRITPSGDWSNILKMEREDRFLVMEVQLGGGCGSHDFKLIKQADAINSSNISSWLLHHIDEDFCKALLVHYLYFDLYQMETTPLLELRPSKVEYQPKSHQ